jgi:hypothetical protein
VYRPPLVWLGTLPVILGLDSGQGKRIIIDYFQPHLMMEPVIMLEYPEIFDEIRVDSGIVLCDDVVYEM